MDIRWQQRFSNYKKALKKLQLAIEVIDNNAKAEQITGKNNSDISDMLKEGLVKRFEYTYELAWNTMKDYAEYQGEHEIKGSRDAIRHAFKIGLIWDAAEWMAMLESRTLTTHTYNKATAEEVHSKIINSYESLFIKFDEQMEKLIKNESSEI